MKTLIFLYFAFIFKVNYAIRCWQCAAVDGRSCPEDANLVNSNTHDACTTWRVGNGSILLQNLVRFSEECTSSKINFWGNFIDLYYKGSGGSVQCCSTDGCNIGSGNLRVSNPSDEIFTPETISGLPAELPGASLSSFLQQTYVPQQAPLVQQNAALINQNNFQVGFVLILWSTGNLFS